MEIESSENIFDLNSVAQWSPRTLVHIYVDEAGKNVGHIFGSEAVAFLEPREFGRFGHFFLALD